MKNRTEVPTEKIMANEVLKRPWIVDFITRLSKIVYFVTITKRMSAERLV